MTIEGMCKKKKKKKLIIIILRDPIQNSNKSSKVCRRVLYIKLGKSGNQERVQRMTTHSVVRLVATPQRDLSASAKI